MKQKNLPNNSLEHEILSQGYNRIVGIDEVGRGCFAGPVYVCGYIYTAKSPTLVGVNDSKQLSKKKRGELFGSLKSHNFLIKEGTVEAINNFGVGKTVINLISEIIVELSDGKTFFLIDGHFSQEFSTYSRQIIKGDTLHYSISCASIIAKEIRDGMMRDMGREFPQYDFEHNVGYGTATHIKAIKQYGITPQHRLSFKPMQKYS
jgi:ribonuclease HII